MKHYFWIFLILFIPSPVLAQCNLRARTVYSSYYTPVYYPPTYNYDYRKRYEKVILVPKAIKVEVTRDHYYDLEPYSKANLLADAIVGRLMRLQSTGTPQAVPVPVPVPTPTGSTGTAREASPITAGAYQNDKVLAVVNASCVKCHGAESKNTRLVTKDGKLADLPAGKIWECFGLVNSGEMPKGSKSLADDDVKLFYEWAKNARK